MQLNGQNKSYALLPLYAAPPPVPAFLGLDARTHIAGEVDLAFTFEAVKQLKENLDDADDVLTWDLDITVGPPWREVRTVAPLVVITDVFSTGTDWDDEFQFGHPIQEPQMDSGRGFWSGEDRAARFDSTSRREAPDPASRYTVPPPGICVILTLLSRRATQSWAQAPTIVKRGPRAQLPAFDIRSAA